MAYLTSMTPVDFSESYSPDSPDDSVLISADSARILFYSPSEARYHSFHGLFYVDDAGNPQGYFGNYLVIRPDGVIESRLEVGAADINYIASLPDNDQGMAMLLDYLFSGPDTISGSEFTDILYGLGSNDVLLGNGGNDLLNGNSDSDSVYGNRGNDTVHGGRDNDAVYGGADQDLVLGDISDDTVSGDMGNDRLYGGRDNDILYGGDGNDSLSGDRGNDTLNGGGGADVFLFTQADGGSDYIQDFVHGQDVLHISSALAVSASAVIAASAVVGFATVITLGAVTITLDAMTGLTASDVIII